MSLIRYATPRRRIHPATVSLAAVAFLLAIYLPAPARGATEFHGRVVGIADGDTITVLHDGRAEKIRLYGIDAPEKSQAFGERAKQFTSGLAFGQTVSVHVRDHDRYRRTVGEVILPDGRSLNEELVRAGYAWWYRRYSRDRKLAHLEQEARDAHRGLWADPHPVPPWDFRRGGTLTLTRS